MVKNGQKIGFSDYCGKFNLLMCNCFCLKSCSIMFFTILRKPHVQENSASRVMDRNAVVPIRLLDLSNLNISRTTWPILIILYMVSIKSSEEYIEYVIGMANYQVASLSLCSRPIRLLDFSKLYISRTTWPLG